MLMQMQLQMQQHVNQQMRLAAEALQQQPQPQPASNRPEKFRWPPNSLQYPAGESSGNAQEWVEFRKKLSGFMGVMNPQATAWQLKSALLNCVTGASQEAVQDLDYLVRDDNVTFEGMLDAYEQRLCPTSSKTIAQAEYRQARQNPGESSLSFFGRLRGYYTRAFPTPGPNTTMQQMYEAFLMEGLLNGLRRDDMRRNLYSKGCSTLDELLQEVAHEESARVSTSVRAGLHKLGQHGNKASTGNRIEPMDVGAINANSGCFNCGAKDHQYRNCTKPKKASQGTPRSGNSAGNNNYKTGNSGRGNAAKPNNRPVRRWRFSPKALNKIQSMLGASNADTDEADAVLCSIQQALEEDDFDFYEEEEEATVAATIEESSAEETAEDFPDAN